MSFAATFGATDAGILVAVLILLGFCAVLAIAETGLVRMTRSRARALLEQGKHGARSLTRLVADPEHFLAPVLLLVLICQLVSATLVGIESSRLFGAVGVVVALVFEVVIIFVFVEAIPKHWAVRQADRAALFAAPIITAVISFPPVRVVSTLLIGLTHRLAPDTPISDDNAEVTESELLALADYAAEEDIIEDEERELISSIIEFGDTIVREVMVPRPDVVAVDQTGSAASVLERAMDAGLSRIPVFNTTLDDVTGVAYVRDLVHATRNGKEDQPVAALSRPAHFVPETKSVAPLLREMQNQQFHLAIVIDEYGGTAGVVTLEDLIEELVGDIADEFDANEPLVVPIGDGDYRVSAKMAVDEVNDLLGTRFPVGDWDTIGGLVLHLKGQVPVAGEAFESAGYRLVPEKVARRRIGVVRITKMASEDASGDSDSVA